MTDKTDDRPQTTEEREQDRPTLDDHPGLDNDEATEKGKMMTASGSLGPEAVERVERKQQ